MSGVEAISFAVGIIGTGISVYQWAVINESKKRKNELQYLLAAIHSLALSKQQGWNVQMTLLPSPKDEQQLENLRIHARARDDFVEMSSLASTLEGTIATDSSAISALLKQALENSKLNNLLQEEALRNPTLPKNQTVRDPLSAPPTTTSSTGVGPYGGSGLD